MTTSMERKVAKLLEEQERQRRRQRRAREQLAGAYRALMASDEWQDAVHAQFDLGVDAVPILRDLVRRIEELEKHFY